ncbi:hypothetical protein AA0481_0070 [Acetobacter orientalis NRIC 0481]|uniref:Uncharacterized protein n=1 Tax=Acetobacter orientalis TaxID=146474 RepID=A0A0D6NFS0_9PROT|nr:hypothetical protein Abor_002_035 [Acetobacter orientalis]GBR12483.1 hypothetical protein AA0481_0070 [Acetobacter orientalis NRIC 0481]GEL61413.1 hypothetical protein AOR02nite_12550 [Acetobacter orientalis]
MAGGLICSYVLSYPLFSNTLFYKPESIKNRLPEYDPRQPVLRTNKEACKTLYEGL